MRRPPRFTIELEPARKKKWKRAADLATPDRERNLAPWMGPILDAAADLQLAGGDPFGVLRDALEKIGKRPTK